MSLKPITSPLLAGEAVAALRHAGGEEMTRAELSALRLVFLHLHAYLLLVVASSHREIGAELDSGPAEHQGAADVSRLETGITRIFDELSGGISVPLGWGGFDHLGS